MMEHEWSKYTEWLVSKILTKTGFPWEQRYEELMDILNMVEFDQDHLIGHDQNRIADGMELRREYVSRVNFFHEAFDYRSKPCTVLEVLVALAIRIDKEYTGTPGEPNPSWIFWKMIHNLGLDKNYDGRCIPEDVHNRLYNLMYRKYRYNGVGGLFPLRARDCEDQRKVEIWYQMLAYVSENLA